MPRCTRPADSAGKSRPRLDRVETVFRTGMRKSKSSARARSHRAAGAPPTRTARGTCTTPSPHRRRTVAFIEDADTPIAAPIARRAPRPDSLRVAPSPPALRAPQSSAAEMVARTKVRAGTAAPANTAKGGQSHRASAGPLRPRRSGAAGSASRQPGGARGRTDNLGQTPSATGLRSLVPSKPAAPPVDGREPYRAMLAG